MWGGGVGPGRQEVWIYYAQLQGIVDKFELGESALNIHIVIKCM